MIPNAEYINPEITDEGLVKLLYKDSGSKYSSRVISDGTLRVLGLLAIISRFNKASLLRLLKNPKNGVHPRRLSIIARLLDNATLNGSHTQVIVTTHSPRLPELLNPTPDRTDSDSRVSLIGSSKRDNETEFTDLYKSPIFARVNAEAVLEEEHVGSTTFEEALMRGDFGG